MSTYAFILKVGFWAQSLRIPNSGCMSEPPFGIPTQSRGWGPGVWSFNKLCGYCLVAIDLWTKEAGLRLLEPK